MQDIVEAIRSPSDYQKNFELLLSIIDKSIQSGNGKNASRAESNALLELLDQIVSNDRASAYTRFSCLMIARDLFARKRTVFINCLSSSKLLQTMTNLALTIDAQRPVEQKGRTLFSDSDLGNKFMRLILQSIQKWAQRHPKTTSQAPTKFKLAYNQLVKAKVTFPKSMEFYSNEKKEKGKQKEVKAAQKVEQTKMPPTPKGQSMEGIDKRSAQQLVKQSLRKIEGFVRFLEQCDDEEQLISEIQMYHKLFQQEMKKNHSLGEKILSEGLLSEEMILLLILVTEFYTNQDAEYTEFLSQRPDLQSYISRVIMNAEPLELHFKQKQKTQSRKTKPPGPVVYQAQQVEQPKKTQEPRISKKLTTEHRSNVISNPDRENPSRYREDRAPVSFIDVINDKELEQIAEQGQVELNEFLSNVNPTVGFKSIKRQLQSQLGNRASKSRSKSARAVSRSKRVRGQLSSSPVRSKSKFSYFDLHPDTVVTNNSYMGSLVLYANQYEVGSIDEHQGSKRLKRSNVSDKGILFENQLLQIGYKSEPCYEEVNGCKVSLKLILYYGNKSESMMTRFQVEFEGDQNSLLYRNPQYLSDEIAPGHQIKQELLIMPTNIPYSLISINVQYAVGRQFPDFTVYLPNSLLKYMVSHPTSIDKFEPAYSRHLDTELRSQVFPLSRDLDPSALQKLFPHMIYLTKTEDFISQRRYTQLVLGLLVLLVDSDEYLIKINIRPNMTAVLQLVILDNSDDSENYAKFLLQSLQFVLQST